MNDAPLPPAPPASPRSRSRRWVWFFVLLAAAAPFAVVIPVWYNHRQQLSLERLAAARQLWQQKGPRDYVVEYAVRLEYNPDPAGRTPERYTVLVRNGKAESVTGADGRLLRASDYGFATMDELFDFIGRQLQADIDAGGRRPFMIAVFSKEDGHVARYRRSVLRTRELLEITVELKSAGDGRSRPPDGT